MSKKSMKKRDKLIIGTIIGGAIGSVLGMMYAPDSGKKTRGKISKFAKDQYSRGREVTTKKSGGLINKILSWLEKK